MMQVLLKLAVSFGILSLLAFGGGNAIIPQMKLTVVNANHWMSAREFLDLFAITRATPGPGSTIVLLIGQKVEGLTGALVAGLAMYTPSCLLAFGCARAWRQAERFAWLPILERALAPIAVGLIFASAIILIRSTEHSFTALATTLVATLLLTFTKLNPMVLLAVVAAGSVLLTQA